MVCIALEINVFALFTPLVVVFLIAIILIVLLLVVLVDFGRRWILFQEKLAAGKTADIHGMQMEIQSLRTTIESMEKKLDHIETILERVGE